MNEDLNEEEFIKVTETFLERLEDSLSNAGCNDLFNDEFPESVIEKFDNDIDLFEAWKKVIYSHLVIKGQNKREENEN